jgi:hypothetical protein
MKTRLDASVQRLVGFYKYPQLYAAGLKLGVDYDIEHYNVSSDPNRPLCRFERIPLKYSSIADQENPEPAEMHPHLRRTETALT